MNQDKFKEILGSVCPICGKSLTMQVHNVDSGKFVDIECAGDFNHNFRIETSLFSKDSSTIIKALNIIASHMLVTPMFMDPNENKPWFFYWDDSSSMIYDHNRINIFGLLKEYPKSLLQRIDAILINISRRYPNFQDEINNEPANNRIFYIESDNKEEQKKEIKAILRFMVELEYLRLEGTTGPYFLTASGWKKIYSLLESEVEIMQGFIAMQFNEKPDKILDAIIQAIENAKYEGCYKAFRMDMKQHNNQIAPEILYEIRRSKFMVVELSDNNSGAYYEAGYATALGKQVIVCCKKILKDKLHFDIAQINMILWINEDDLTKQLIDRIGATVK